MCWIHHVRNPVLKSLLAAAGLLAGCPAALAEIAIYDQPPIRYSDSTADDPVSRANQALDQKQIALDSSAKRGYLDAVLRELKISPSSQAAVFTKTSFQREHISPRRPRAIYFDDDTYVGYVPGADVLEVATTDPKLGIVFYTIDQRQPGPRFVRQTENCLQCHGESMTRNVPGLMVRSVFSDADGQPITSAGTFLNTHESPLAERWGGWIVTGAAAAQRHMGNTIWTEHEGQPPTPARTDVNDLFAADSDAYPSAQSDVVTLMVLEHQVEAHNRITRANYATRRALWDEKVMADALGETLKPGVHSESTTRRIEGGCEPLVEYLLFSGEAALEDPLVGDADFLKDFAQRGPRDSKGRSLRDFDLKTRLFRYPCSYLIYSPSVQQLPEPAKAYVYRRLSEVLTGKDTNKPFAHLSTSDRGEILEILRETLPGFASN